MWAKAPTHISLSSSPSQSKASKEEEKEMNLKPCPFCAVCGEPIEGIFPPKKLKNGAYICPKCELEQKEEYFLESIRREEERRKSK